ncbi:MAG: tetratricopeptide repeat protein, partial [Holophagales bacterium]|nr:tetratricopeptide repeat protein [Holophagales bacterium]
VLVSLLLLSLLSPAAFAAGTAKKEEPEDSAETAYNAGVEQMKAGNWADAAKHLGEAVEMKGDFAEAHSNLGYCLRKQGAEHYKVALKHYNRAIELDSKLAQAYHYRGVLHALAGDEALAKADHATLMDLDRELADELMAVIASGEEPEGHNGAVGWD